MKWILSRYNHDISYLPEYTNDYVIYDRSPQPVPGAIIVPNIGSDIYDKFTYIIDNYEDLPEVAVYTKANIFKYITKEEFDLIKDSKTFTPILSQFHKEIMCDQGMLEALDVQAPYPYSYYKDGMYYELNYPSYLRINPVKNQPVPLTIEFWQQLELPKLLGIDKMRYTPFAPGSNYILPKENILKHPKELYIKLRSFIDWAVYPGEVFIMERGLYNLWK